MKFSVMWSLAAVLALFLVHPVQAGGYAASAGYDWADIKADSSLLPSFPTIPMAGSLVTIDELCATEDALHLKGMMRERCVEFSGYESGECLEYANVHYRTPRAHVEERCTSFTYVGDNMECASYDRIMATYPLTWNVTVNYLEPAGDGYMMVPAFSKEYTIPFCQ